MTCFQPTQHGKTDGMSLLRLGYRKTLTFIFLSVVSLSPVCLFWWKPTAMCELPHETAMWLRTKEYLWPTDVYMAFIYWGLSCLSFHFFQGCPVWMTRDSILPTAMWVGLERGLLLVKLWEEYSSGWHIDYNLVRYSCLFKKSSKLQISI